MLTAQRSLYNRPRLPPAGALLVGSRPPAAERPLLGVFSPVTSPYKPHGAVELVLESLPSVCSSTRAHRAVAPLAVVEETTKTEGRRSA